MTTLVSMIRGINVAGNCMVRMERLRAIYEGLGCAAPRTYLQSGNVVCGAKPAQARGLGEAVERRILRDCGFPVSVAVRTAAQMTAAFAANPLLGRRAVDPQFLHATFLVDPGAEASLDGIELPLSRGELAVAAGSVVYVYCPNGYGVSKIHNGFFERKLGTRATTRNWRTVAALEAMARDGGPPR